MSEVYIPDMPMPKSCMVCSLNYNAQRCIVTGSVFRLTDDFDPFEERLPDCPLKEGWSGASTEHLREKIAEVIERKLSGDPSCEDLRSLAQAVSELERNDLFRTLTSMGTVHNGVASLESAFVEKNEVTDE